MAIADDLMKDGRYAEAWPYAEAAAQTWAGWAMQCAQNCAEGLKNWDAAEEYARALSERYPDQSWTDWFVFCERTGHGDITGARAWTKEYARDLLENPDLPAYSLIVVSYVHVVCGDKAKAAIALRKVPKDVSDQHYLISLAAVADLADANDVRDAAFERFCTAYKTDSPKTTQALQVIRDAIAAKKPGELDLKTIDGIFEKAPNAGSIGAAFVVAAHLMANGHRDLAKRFWLVVSDRQHTNLWWRVIALSILRERYRNESGSPTGPREI